MDNKQTPSVRDAMLAQNYTAAQINTMNGRAYYSFGVVWLKYGKDPFNRGCTLYGVINNRLWLLRSEYI